jgi:hypothetical protein
VAVGTKKVFLSVGRQYGPRYTEFVGRLRTMLSDSGFVVFELPTGNYQNPLDRVFAEMAQCDAAIVVCFERVYGAAAQEFRTGPEPKAIKPLTLTTVWNHVEAAIARKLDLPTLILAEQGCRVEGVLDPVIQFRICWMDFDTAELQTQHFKSVFADWRDTAFSTSRLAQAGSSPSTDLEVLARMPLMKVISSMQWRHWTALMAYSAALLAFGATAGPLLLRLLGTP